MPRGGSRKGEHRGAAKREAKSGAAKKPAPKVETRGRPKGSLNAATKERLQEIAQAIGIAELDGVMPKQVMMDVMKTFMRMAMDEQKAINDLVGSEDEGSKSKMHALLISFEKHMILAGDMAYKCAPYYHPRLQALAVMGQNGDRSAGDVMRELLNEIDDETRAERRALKTIDHEPTAH